MGGTKTEKVALSQRIRAGGGSWTQVAAEFRARWGLNARQTLRLGRGWSQQQVADEWCRRWPDDPKTFKNVSTWERWPQGGHAPSLRVLDRLAQIYRCSVADLVADLGEYGIDSSGLAVDDPAMDRRQMLTGLGGTLAAAALHRHKGAPLGSDSLGYYAAQLRSHWQTDRALGPYEVIDAALAQCRSVRLAVNAPTTGNLRCDTLELATAYAGFISWLYQDAGDLATCSHWLDETLELAHRSENPDLVAYALAAKAMARLDANDGRGAIDLASAALAVTTAPASKARVMALQHAAHGHALTGNRSDVDRLLDAMGATLEAQQADRRPWGGDRLERSAAHVVGVQRAACYGRLGLDEEAARIWDDIHVSGMTSDRRDAGVYAARQAMALLGAGEPAAATRHAARGLDHLRATGSARLRTELKRLHDKAVPWTTTAAGRELQDVLNVMSDA